MDKSFSLPYPLVSDQSLSRDRWRARAVVVTDVLLVFVTGFLIVVRAKEYFNVNALLLVIAAGCVLKNFLWDESWQRAGRLNLLDVSIMTVAGVELLNYLTSSYRPNTFLYLNDVLFLFLFYWLIRFNLNRDYQRTALFVVLTVCGVVLAGFAVYYSWTLRGCLAGLGFTDVTNFRNYIYFLNPIGQPIGVWATIFFPLLCFPVILLVKFRHSRLARVLFAQPIGLILVALALTFIRGVYIGLAAWFALLITLMLVYRVFPVRTILRAGLILPTLVIPGLLPVLRPVMTTLSLFSTTSQVRSFNGRTKLWADSWQMVKDHLWFGVGSGNFVMKHMAYRATDDDAAFVLRPFNVLLQIIAEKGVVGLLAYGFLAIAFLWVSHRKLRALRHNSYEQFVVLIFVTAFIGMLVRDMSESSMLVNGGVGVMLTYMFAHNAHAGEHEKQSS